MMRGNETYTTSTPEETEGLGAALAKMFRRGERVGLVGELGSGKTRFVRGVARGLAARGHVKSPSFTIINIYGGTGSDGAPFEMYHIDLYRLGSANEFYDAGLEEYIYGEGISVIEWADKIPAILSECGVVIRFRDLGEGKREITVERVGDGK